jgi:hypothetical protein
VAQREQQQHKQPNWQAHLVLEVAALAAGEQVADESEVGAKLAQRLHAGGGGAQRRGTWTSGSVAVRRGRKSNTQTQQQCPDDSTF